MAETQNKSKVAAGGSIGMPNNTTIDRNTAISIGLLVTLVGGVIAIVMFINSQFAALKMDYSSRFRTIELTLSQMNTKILRFEYGTEDRWKGKDMKIWALELQRDNPELVVPDPWVVQRSTSKEARDNTGGK